MVVSRSTCSGGYIDRSSDFYRWCVVGSAPLVIELHGDGAEVYVQEMLDSIMAEGDLIGAGVWCELLRQVRVLSRRARG